MSTLAHTTVLLIEDEHTPASSEAAAIARIGYEVISAASADDAVALAIGTERISLVIIDLDIGPGVDVLTTASRILNRRDIPIIFLTSHAGRRLGEKVRGITRFGYLIKNSDDILLRASIEMAYELHDAQKLVETKMNELGKSEARFRAAFEQGGVGMCLTALDGNLIDVNEAFCAMLGYTRDEMLGFDFDAITDGHDTTPTIDILRRAITEGSNICRFSKRYMHKDGRIVWADVSSVLLRDLDGTPMHFITHVQDVTEQRRAEQTLQEHTIKLELAMLAANMAWWEMDVVTGAVQFNKRKAEMLGYPPERFTHYGDFTALVHPDDHEHAMDAMRGHFQGRFEKYDCEYRILTASGEYKWFHDIGEIVRRDASGAPLRVAGTVLDITGRKQSELALRESEGRQRAMIANIADVIAIVDVNGVVTYVSGNIEKLFGWRPEELIGLPYTHTAHPDDCERLQQAFASLVKRENSTTTIEYRFTMKGGDVHAIQLTATNLVHSPIIHGVLVNFHDITEFKKTEQILRDTQRRESIGILSGGIAHDFNNLLGTMMGNISLAQQRLPPDHPAVPNIEKALTAMEHAADLTKQMLAYAGKGRVENRTIDLAALVAEHVRLFEVSLAKNVKLATHLPALPVHVVGDQGQLEQVVMNLIINGGDAIGEHQGIVSIEVAAVPMTLEELLPFTILSHRELRDGVYAMLEVTDTGAGMSPETVKKIFDPFFTTKVTGRGLGLSAVLGIIHGHDGGIAITSIEGKGTTFRVILPLATAHEHGDDPAVTDVRESPAAPATILIIDDEQALAETAHEILETGGHSVVMELNPRTAVGVFRQRWREIGLVLLDLTMPEMSGREVLEALREIDPNVTIVISSGYSEDEMLKKIGAAKVSAFIQKPYRVESLLSVVRRAMNVPSDGEGA